MFIHIKNMVCPRCIMAVEDILKKLGIPYSNIKLGEVQTNESLENTDLDLLKKELENIGFELIENKKIQLVEKIKATIIELIHHLDPSELKVNYSEYISKKAGKEYSYLTAIFSEIENITIEKFIIQQKIEKVKELIVYEELNFSEIAYRMDYSSVAHLSKQFKQVTGFTPSQFRKIKSKKRRSLDSI